MDAKDAKKLKTVMTLQGVIIVLLAAMVVLLTLTAAYGVFCDA